MVIEDRPKPELRDPYDVMVHVAQTGICGSDVSCLLSLIILLFISLTCTIYRFTSTYFSTQG